MCGEVHGEEANQEAFGKDSIRQVIEAKQEDNKAMAFYPLLLLCLLLLLLSIIITII